MWTGLKLSFKRRMQVCFVYVRCWMRGSSVRSDDRFIVDYICLNGGWREVRNWKKGNEWKKLNAADCRSCKNVIMIRYLQTVLFLMLFSVWKCSDKRIHYLSRCLCLFWKKEKFWLIKKKISQVISLLWVCRSIFKSQL